MQPAADPSSDQGRRTVGLVIPLFDERDVLPMLIEAVEAFRAEHPYVTEVVLVDDGSRDGTADLARMLTADRPGYLVARFSRNFGHQLAVTAGMRLCTADAAVVLDADLQDPLDVIPRMVERWREGYDVVYGVRERRVGESAFKRGTAAVFYRFFRWMTDLDLPLDTGDFRLVARPVLDAYARFGEQQPFVRGLVAWLGFRQTGVAYERAPRAAGATKYPLRRMWRLATTSLTSFSDKPLRFAVRIGLAAAGIAVLGLIWVLLNKLVFGQPVIGWASLIFSVFFFGGLQLFFLGVLGAYLVRVYDEVKGRPRYLIRDVWASEGTPPPKPPPLRVERSASP